MTGTVTSAPPICIMSQDIGSTRGYIIPHEFRNAHPFKKSINQFFPEHGHPTPIFSKEIGRKTVSDKSADVNSLCGMNLGRNCVLSESLNFMDFGLSTANTPDKLKYIIVPTTRVRRLTNVSDWLRPMDDIEEVTAEILSKKNRAATILKKTSLKL